MDISYSAVIFVFSKFVFMATENGTVKKTELKAFSNERASGIIAIDLRDDNQLVDVAITEGDSEVMLFTSQGKAIRFDESDVRGMGRTAAGVRGIKMPQDIKVNALIILDEGRLLMATENGYGKRTDVEQFSKQKRGGSGVIAIQTSTRNGKAVGAVQVSDDDEIMLITNGGTLVRTPVRDVSITSRNTQGVRLIKLGKGEVLCQIERIASMDDEDGGHAESDAAKEAENTEKNNTENPELDSSDDSSEA